MFILPPSYSSALIHHSYLLERRILLPIKASRMYCPSIFALLAVALTHVSAASYPTNTTTATSPISTTNTTNTSTTLPDGPTEEYYLVTKVIGYGNEDKNGLYVNGYHTGEGFTLIGSTDGMAMSWKADQ